MSSDPPNIGRDGEPGGPREDFRIPSSDGFLDTRLAEEQMQQFLDPGTELPPDILAEQTEVLLRPGDVIAKRFEVVKQLGFGGMGAVYQVTDRHLGGYKALKVMLPSLLKSEAARRRFLDEVVISQHLRHEGVVTVYDLGEDPQRQIHFFTMEFVEGHTLHRHLQERGGKLPVSEALDIARQLCDALEYAHQHTIHRDLKPQNIMVQPDGRIKILDFGLAKVMSPGRMTKSSMALGTAYYQAPEQSIHLKEVDPRADIYSTGVILYQMLTGAIPVGRVKQPSTVMRGIRRSLDDVVLRCLEPDADDRYPSAAALRQTLEHGGKAGRRKWVLPVLAVAILLVLAGLALKLGTVPNERSETGLSPTPPSQSSDTRDETRQSPITEGSSPTEPTATVPLPSEELAGSSSTAAEASTARQAAVAAQQAAQGAGAEEHAQQLWDEAVKQLKQAEAHDTLEAFDDAIGGYNAAANTFKEAETEAARIAGEIEGVEKAKGAMQTAKAEAGQLDAPTHARVRYEQAVKAEEEAAAIADDRVAAAEAYQKAAQRYQLAVDETKQLGATIMAAAKKGAEAAREKADTADVKKYSAKELEDAQALLDKAVNTGDFQEAKGLYEQSAAKYASAVDEAGKRKEAEAKQLAQAKADMEEAREEAQTVKAMIGADERRYAQDEVSAGDTAWSSALDAETDYVKAEGFYEEAKERYAKAVEIAPERKRAAATPSADATKTVDLGSGVTMELVWIPPGEFMMGSPNNEANRDDDEGPQHRVQITQGFWMGKHEVTQAQWEAVMGSNPSNFEGDRNPVEQVSWDDCQTFLGNLNSRVSGGRFRLPTEAEWEYACRAGSPTAYCFGDDASRLSDYAWYDDNSGEITHPVGQKKPNAWGLYDMHGNVWEWCGDWFGDYPSGAVTDPTGPSSGSLRVLRGGGWDFNPRGCRSASRGRLTPVLRLNDLGFRVALPAVQSRP